MWKPLGSVTCVFAATKRLFRLRHRRLPEPISRRPRQAISAHQVKSRRSRIVLDDISARLLAVAVHNLDEFVDRDRRVSRRIDRATRAPNSIAIVDISPLSGASMIVDEVVIAHHCVLGHDPTTAHLDFIVYLKDSLGMGPEHGRVRVRSISKT